VLVSRIPQIIALAETNATRAVAETVQDIETKAKAAAPVLTTALRDSIEGHASGKQGKVTASDESAFYQEFGTTRHGPQPFLIPATLDSAEAFYRRLVAGI
jgi:HK97 gp10 family phage protein